MPSAKGFCNAAPSGSLPEHRGGTVSRRTGWQSGAQWPINASSVATAEVSRHPDYELASIVPQSGHNFPGNYNCDSQIFLFFFNFKTPKYDFSFWYVQILPNTIFHFGT